MAVKDTDTDVLLIEDDRYQAQLMLAAFKKNNPGKKILWLDDGEKALQYLLSYGVGMQKNDITVLLDLSIPKIDGFELMQAVKRGNSDAAIDFIVITGSENANDLALSYRYGAKAYMKKSIVCENCLQMI
jgi:CheY-like chemotaxis protein